jgi:hypothetical protein
MLVPVAVRSEAQLVISWTLRFCVRILLMAWMFALVFLCCVVLCRQRLVRRADHSSKEALANV